LEPSLHGPSVMPRLVIGYVFALCLLVLLSAGTGSPLHGYAVGVSMQSVATGQLQVFYDTGGGFSEQQSAVVPLQPAVEAHMYRLPIPPGRYQSIRLDLRTLSGRYVIDKVSILAPDGSVAADVLLTALTAIDQLTIVEQTQRRLVLDALANDPQLLYRPETAVVIPDPLRSSAVSWLLVRLALFWIAGTGAIWLLQIGLRTMSARLDSAASRASSLCDRHRRRVVCLTGAIVTIAATYPVLFLGRSLVAPNNHGTPLLYGEAPFTPGSSDVVLENVRGSDVWAALLQEVPHSHVQREALAKHEIPLWNRYNAAGRPLWGQGLTSVLDPLHWLTFVTADPAPGWDLKYAAHRLVFAVGMGLATLAAVEAWLPAAVVTAASPFMGIYTYRLNHPATFALTYAPWALLACFRLAQARDKRRKALAGIGLAVSLGLVLVAGTPKDAAIILLSVGAICVLVLSLSPGSRRDRLDRFSVALLAGVAAVLLTAPHWLVFLETLAQSYTAYDQPYVQFAGRREALGFFLGPLMPGPLQPGLHLVALVFIVAAISAARRIMRHPAIVACALVAAVLAAIAFGALPASAIVRIPLLANIGHINDAFLTAALVPTLIVSAIGVNALYNSEVRRRALVALAILAASWFLARGARSFVKADSLELLVPLLLFPVAVAVPFCFSAAGTGPEKLIRAGAIGLAVCVLLVPGGLHTDTGVAILDDFLLQPRMRSNLDQNSAAVDQAVHRSPMEPARAAGVDWTLFAGSQAIYELESIGGTDPLEVPAYRELMDGAGIWRSLSWMTMVPTADVLRLAPLLDLLNVRFLLIPTISRERVRVAARETAWPRAFFVDGVETYEKVPDLLGKVRERHEPLAAVQVNDSQAIDATREMPRSSSTVIPAGAYKLTVNSTSFVVRAPGKGVVALEETYLPRDFRATLNGRPVSYFRVNHAFKGLAIPSAGDWIVRFEYRPYWWNLSLMLAAAGFGILVAVGVSAMRAYRAETTFSEYPAARASS
jgi:hypothetical protein